MPTIDQFQVPPEILVELKKMLEEAPDDAILSYVEVTPILTKGFRPGSKKSVAPMRKRMLRLLETDREIDLLLLGTIATASKIGALTSRMSDLAITETLSSLVALHGRNPVLAALLADYRVDIRDIGVGVLEGDTPLEPVKTEQASDVLFECFEPFLSSLKKSISGKEALLEEPDTAKESAPADSQGESDRLRKRIAELEGELKRQAADSRNEKEYRKRLDTLNQQKQKLEKDLRESARRTAQEEMDNRALKAQLKQAVEKNAALEATISERVAHAVREELEATRNRWLSRPLAAEREADTLRAAGGADELLTRVESVLSRQAEVDRHSGNLTVIRGRIERLNAVLQTVRTAMAEALHPLPELAQVQSNLVGEISRLEALAGGKRTVPNDFVARMRMRINTAGAEDELAGLQEFLDRLNELNALSPPELQELYRCCHNRMSIVYASYTPTVIRGKRYPRDPVWRLLDDVQEDRALVLILDGHNVVHLLPNLFGDSYENGIPGAATRAALVQRVVQALKGAGKCQAHVFFDAPTPGRHQRAENVWEVYSGGGQAEHRADKAITDYLEYCCQTMSAMPRLLVTDDRSLRTRAVELGAKFMPVPQFGAFLEEMRK